MSKQQILDNIKKEVIPILIEADVIKAAFFGSYVRGDNTQESDIDILVDLPRGKTFVDLIRLENNLSEKLHKKVDLVTYNGINSLLKNNILKYQYSIL